VSTTDEPTFPDVTDISGRLHSVQAEVNRLKAEIEFKEESVLYRVSDWLRSIGQPELGNRVDPRQGDTIRILARRAEQELADTMKSIPHIKDN
jgi:hypothetical protein